MKYYLDTEFHEYKTKPLLGKGVDTIELISIGLVTEEGKEYYAISKDFDLRAAWDNQWLRSNVLVNLFNTERFGFYDKINNFMDFKALVNHFGVTKKEIAKEVETFIWNYSSYPETSFNTPQFYGYYSDYDWVVFCWLFGRMVDLPNGFPMYCGDLKQIEQEVYLEYKNCNDFKVLFRSNEIKSKHWPKHLDEHNALADAKWNRDMHQFLQLMIENITT